MKWLLLWMQTVLSRCLARAKCPYGAERWGGCEMTCDRGHESNLNLWCCGETLWGATKGCCHLSRWKRFPTGVINVTLQKKTKKMKKKRKKSSLSAGSLAPCHVTWLCDTLTHFRTVRQRRADTVDAGRLLTGSVLHTDMNTNTIHRGTIVHVEQQQ